MTDEKIKELPVKFKTQPDDNKFLVVPPSKCPHGLYNVDEKLAEVTCRKCGEKMNPMYVLKEMAMGESQWHRTRQMYQEEMKRLTERSRTKCRFCGKITPISHA